MEKHIRNTLLLFILVVLSCTTKQDNETSSANKYASSSVFEEKTHPSYATLFTVKYTRDYKVIDVKNPFDTTKRMERYILVDRNKRETLTNLPQGKVIEIPVQSLGIVFATHVGYAGKLGLLDKITGVSQKKYLKNEQLKEKIERGEVGQFGPSHNINIEKILSINPELLLVAPFKDNRYDKVNDVGIQLAVNASYMETTPLARAEWIKFIACFFNKEQKANRIFDSIATHYHKLDRLTNTVTKKPTVFSGKKIGQVWYVPGGNSYIAKFFEDAGADYLWKNNSKSGSLPLDFETVYMKARNADFWTMKENVAGPYSYDQLGREYVHYSSFKAFQNENVLFCNTHTKPYYEEGILEPHVILADLIHLLHPNLLPDHKPKYYEKLN